MKTQDSIDEQLTQPGTSLPKRKGTSWLASAGAILVVALIIGVSVVVFTQLGRQHQNQSPIPASGKWVQALHGYTLASLQAAASNPATLYACAMHSQPNSVGTNGALSYTILRSTDFGSHWQDVGGKAALGISCQLAINPSNSNELYAIGMSNTGTAQISSVLKQSLNGGQTWTTISPALSPTGTGSISTWNVQQLGMAGNTLFGLQWFAQNIHPVGRQGILPKYYPLPTRLVKSTDGGHTWTVLNQHLTTPGQGVSDYVVDPTNAATIYALVGVPWSPILPRGVEPNDSFPVFGANSDLYKTTDGGATWHLLLRNLLPGSRLQLAKDNPQLLYVGGSMPLQPYLERVPVAGYPRTNAPGSFSLQMSSDGGATWRVVSIQPQLPQASRLSFIQTWFVSSRGQVYTYSTGSPTSIRRYDPSSNNWSGVTAPPTSGILLTVTPGDANSDVLWFAGSSDGQSALYRYVS